MRSRSPTRAVYSQSGRFAVTGLQPGRYELEVDGVDKARGRAFLANLELEVKGSGVTPTSIELRVVPYREIHR